MLEYLMMVGFGMNTVFTYYYFKAIKDGQSQNRFYHYVVHQQKSALNVWILTSSKALGYTLFTKAIIAKWIAPIFELIPALLYGLDALFRSLPTNRFSRFLSQTTQFLESVHERFLDYIFVGYLIGLFALGRPELGVVLSLSTMLGFHCENGVYSSAVVDRLKLLSSVLSVALAFYTEYLILAILGGLNLALSIDHFVVNTIRSALLSPFQFAAHKAYQAINFIHPYVNIFARIKENIDRSAPSRQPKFSYQDKPNVLYERIKGLATHPNLRINKHFIKEYNNHIPLERDDVNDQVIIDAFNTIDWISIIPKLKQKIEFEPSAQVKGFMATKNPQECIDILRKSLETYVDMIRNNKGMFAIVRGVSKVANRHLDNVIHLLPQANPALKEKLLSDFCIEGVNVCPDGKYRVLESVSMTLSAGKDANIKPEIRISNLLMKNRELACVNLMIIAREKNSFFSWYLWSRSKFAEIHDTHENNILLGLFTPNLGLPQLAALADPSSPANATSSWRALYSYLSPVEKWYWGRTKPMDYITEISTSWFANTSFGMKDYLAWFNDFVDNRTTGTKAEKDDLKEMYENYPTAENIPRDLIALMLLDMGVLHLENNNKIELRADSTPLFVARDRPTLTLAYNQESQNTKSDNLEKKCHKQKARLI